jgi:CRISPR-associated protein Csb2
MAFADMGGDDLLDNLYEPGNSGQPLAVPMPGTLDDLYRTYDRFTRRAAGTGVDTHTRPAVVRVQSYRRAGDVIRPAARFMLMKPETDATRPVAWENCMKVAGWLRHAAAESLEREDYEQAFINRYIQGHTKEGAENERLSYVPVPSTYGRYNDGLIRRALVLEPPDSDGKVIHQLQFKLAGRVLLGSSGHAECYLAPGLDTDWTFSRYLGSAGATLWRSATPVVLHGFNTSGRGKISPGKTESLLLRAFEMAGYPESVIEKFTFQSGPWWPGTKHASAMRVPDHLHGYPRIHVEVRFRRAITGPVLAGIGRHYGIGLFAKVS